MSPGVDLAALYSALDCAKSMIVFSSRDWSRNQDDVILYAVLVGWGDDEEPGDDGLGRFAGRFGWDESMLTRVRTMRSAVEAFDINAIGDLMALTEAKPE